MARDFTAQEVAGLLDGPNPPLEMLFTKGRWALVETDPPARCPNCGGPVLTTDYGGCCRHACWAELARADGLNI